MTTTERTALYRVYDDEGVLLYAGISDRVGTRWEQHSRNQPWWPSVRHQTATWYDSREEALDAEAEAIDAEDPLFNIVRPRWDDRPRPQRQAGRALRSDQMEEIERRLDAGEGVQFTPDLRRWRKTSSNAGYGPSG